MTPITAIAKVKRNPPMTKFAVRRCSGFGRVMPNVSINNSVRYASSFIVPKSCRFQHSA